MEQWSAHCWQVIQVWFSVITGASLLLEPRPHHEEVPPTTALSPPSLIASDVTGQELEGSSSGGSR